ncbi:hypothetical protein VNI00_012051 [Paramarasmius palmivorus]|uniref:THO1-MOS11 C-terminal domain-containing protein n=1 Tax=Paramarasmius palmivorus TaxID=297713 RepID=A0AAW0C7U4_9AGAR
MEAKLKALTVNDLKAILTKAEEPANSRAKKQDLITKILASEKALAAYNALHPSATDDLLAPPEDVDWAADDALKPIEEPPAPVSKPEPIPAPSQPTSTTLEAASSTEAAPSVEPAAPPQPAESDPEGEKRKQRAARFGIPVVEPKPKSTPKGRAAISPEEQDKLKARAARFGIQTDESGKRLDSAKSNRKRRSEGPADPEEEGKRQKRTEKFGAQKSEKASDTPVDPEEEERRKKRAERFGVKPGAS